MMDESLTVVEKWLNSLDLAKYGKSFLDNGYDDLEICKQLGEPDLDAIGVDSSADREQLLKAVEKLNKQGNVIEYHTLEEDNEGPPEPPVTISENVHVGPFGPDALQFDLGTGRSGTPQGQPISQPVVRFTKIQLNLLLKEKLLEDYIDLSNPPYTLQVSIKDNGSCLTAGLWKYHARLVRPGPISFRTSLICLFV